MGTLKAYKHSGRITAPSLFAGLFLAVGLGWLGGLAAAYSQHYIQFIYINIVVVVGAAFLPALGAGFSMRSLGARNSILTILVTFVTSIITLYTAWIYWISMHMPPGILPDTLTLYQRPVQIWELANLINKDGTWALGRNSKTNVNGVFLWIVWGAEAVTVLAGGIISGRMAMKGIYCERCSQWTPDEAIIAVFGNLPDEARIVDGLKRGDFDSALAIAKPMGGVAENPVKSMRLLDQACPKCRRTRAISFVRHTLTVAKDGTNNEKSVRLFDRLLLTEDQAGILESALSKYQAANPPVVPVEAAAPTA